MWRRGFNIGVCLGWGIGKGVAAIPVIGIRGIASGKVSKFNVEIGALW